ncbi:hypothetical protein Poli38472_013331 [Pythium oligandrum]|uniref:Uncharacterized protein n=1 Tax=Pythium oligandrum TaxID=41045 RepID=A0A8K1FFP1_PYTOL|nr:hypothetical protein Poli38472_013331 [Pythium oligandrum]|eukprot:TMW57857.1 hypothetical protein Poli38472_013331 [Pythium oligandrum]
MTEVHDEQRLDHFGSTWCLPIMLLMNCACFQYLLLLFHRRWREPRVMLLLTVSAIGFIVLIPYATRPHLTVDAMNDVSESCLALLLLVQTVLVGSSHSDAPLGPKILKRLADLLILFDVAVVILGFVAIFDPSVVTRFGGADAMNNVSENVTLAFTFLYRFGLLWCKKGWRRLVLVEDNWELFWHAMFMTHEYVFMLLEYKTRYSWERVQGVYMRVTLTPCIWMTVGDHHNFHLVRRGLSEPKSSKATKSVVDPVVAINDKAPTETSKPTKDAAGAPVLDDEQQETKEVVAQEGTDTTS